MTFFNYFYLDNEKDIVVELYKEKDRMYFRLKTPNHHSGNLIRNLARVCGLELSKDEEGLFCIKGEIPCFIDGNNEEVYIFRLKNIKTAEIFPDGRVDIKASIPAIAKTLMSQTRDYKLDLSKTVFRTYVKKDVKFHSDLHTHMSGNIKADILIALGIYHQIRYPLYYIKKLNLKLTDEQLAPLFSQRHRVEKQFVSSGLKGKYLDRKIDDNTFINFADLILNNLNNARENIAKIRNSLVILKDGQAVFTNLEKVYIYRYVFTKGVESEEKIPLEYIDVIPDIDVRNALYQMQKDKENKAYCNNSIYQDMLLWIARGYKKQGVYYVEIADTTLVKKYESVQMLEEVHAIMPEIFYETGVMIRFLAAMRRIPLTIIKDQKTPADYLSQNVQVLRAVAMDPYVAGCDFVGEEINDIITLKPVFKEIVKICKKDPSFVIRVHAGENDSQKDNIAHSIKCVKDSLEPGQKMPQMRLGHGLYTYSLRSKKGKAVLKELKENNIVLEFQLTSNVRLNNLNSLENHPLKQYLHQGISCVQGSDGAALYGTNSIDEELSLEKLLELSHEDLLAMRNAEEKIIQFSKKAYSDKKWDFQTLCAGRSIEETLLEEMDKESGKIEDISINQSRKYDSYKELRSQVRQLPWDRIPLILMGGSFNTEKRVTRVKEEGLALLKELMDNLPPEEVFFVIGNKLSGYEKYLIDNNKGRFEIYAVVPSHITEAEKKKLEAAGVFIRVSPEQEGMGIYKSFNYEIFERRPSIVAAFDGNSAGANLIQEAKNGKGRAKILIWEKSRNLKTKAESLEGYVSIFGENESLSKKVLKIIKASEEK
ncbi:Adenosine/AMP deaminase [Acetitomaculum ruminis DSM 5522]|uniref:adenosine deaminase n=1 Tax=Acetitomaculum ruminis DSM 5522 TaxID=1120918 RepID=A0A1I0ZN31_9FIRM|nr:adenosine deaminase [Acetitomaculum ruminis]SFB27094.1 Adenosine/AMP deaminase [Acetitomaculum ruminis DSM 5522]